MAITKRLFIHAPNVHQGGGAVLLRELLVTLPTNISVVLHVDVRMTLPLLSAAIQIKRFPPSLQGRWQAEQVLSKTAQAEDTVLCFGNLPPLLKTKAQVYLFLQNRYLIDNCSLAGFSFFVRLRFTIERLWLKFANKRVYIFIVQTFSMQQLLQKYLQRPAIVKIMPLVDELITAVKPLSQFKDYDFIYVASGDPHKNHENLIKAWILLAKENIYPSLLLTIDGKCYPELWAYIAAKKQEYNLAIDNDFNLTRAQLAEYYAKAKACIYPSRLESFGLPLLEAAQAGLPIVASELDFVRDLVEPVQTFDPVSPVSIKRAVKRHLSQAEMRVQPIDGNFFWQQLLDK